MTPRIIETTSFQFSYPGTNRAAVRDLTFSVERGEIFGFLGPSGAGKSTTQNVLIRLLDGYAGSIVVLGAATCGRGMRATIVESGSRSRHRITVSS